MGDRLGAEWTIGLARNGRSILPEYTVGGLVPSLLIPHQPDSPPDQEHVGTHDLDLGLTLALLEEERYQALAERLRRAGFHPDRNDFGRPVLQRWISDELQSATIDFLIQPTGVDARGGSLHHIENDLAAIITPGLRIAFRDRQRILLSGNTRLHEHADRYIQVCGPGAFVVLKCLAFGRRAEWKDAYDLYFTVRYYGDGPEDVADRLNDLGDDPCIDAALDILGQNFLRIDALGPLRVAHFLTGSPNDEIQADVVGLMSDFLRLCGCG